MATRSSRKADMMQRIMSNIHVSGHLTASYSYIADENVGTVSVGFINNEGRLIEGKPINISESGPTQVKISSPLMSDAYFNLSGVVDRVSTWAPYNASSGNYQNSTKVGAESGYYINGSQVVIVVACELYDGDNTKIDTKYDVIQAVPTAIYAKGKADATPRYQGIGFSTTEYSSPNASISRAGFANSDNKGFYVTTTNGTFRFSFND